MTYAMKIQEERDEARKAGRAEGRIIGRDEGILGSIQSLMANTGWTKYLKESRENCIIRIERGTA